MPKGKQIEVGVLNVFKVKINTPVQNRNTIPLVFEAVVSKGADPQFIKYDDLKKRYPYILIDFLQQKISINATKQVNLPMNTQNKQFRQTSPKNEEETSSNHEQNFNKCKSAQDDSYEEESCNHRSGKIQVRITRQRSKVQASLSSKRFITQTGKAVKVLPKTKQTENKRLQQGKKIQLKKNELIYDQSLIQQRYAYNKVYYQNIISKGILHTKNCLRQQPYLARQQQPKQDKSVSVSKSKSKSKARSRKKSGRK